MGSVSREIVIDASPEHVWDAVRDFVDGPLRMGPGVFTDSKLVEPGVRELTFTDGSKARERLIAQDEQARRMVWGWVGEEVEHDNTSMQVFADGTERSRLVWIHDTLPDELTGWLATAMDQLAPVFKEAFKTSSEAAH
ncbi:SRPBCC family protein [Yinghuangia aomiensis]